MKFQFTLVAMKYLNDGIPDSNRAFNRVVKADSQLEAQWKIGRKWFICSVEEITDANRKTLGYWAGLLLEHNPNLNGDGAWTENIPHQENQLTKFIVLNGPVSHTRLTAPANAVVTLAGNDYTSKVIPHIIVPYVMILKYLNQL